MAEFDIDDYVKRATGTASVGEASAPASGAKFYQKPINVPGWLKGAGRMGARMLGAPGAVIGGALGLGEFMKETVEPAVVGAMAGPGMLTPEFRKTVQGAGGVGAFVRRAEQNSKYPAMPMSAMAEDSPGVAAPIATPSADPVRVADSGIQFAPLPNAPQFTVRSGVRGIGGISGIGNTTGSIDNNNVGNIAGNFVGAMLGMKQIAGDNAQRLARNKLAVDTAAKASTARKEGAETLNLEARGALALDARKRGAPESEVSAILSGRAVPGEKFTGFPTMSGEVDVMNRSTGAVTRRKPAQEASEANIAASMKARKLTREQAIEEYRKQGFDVSRVR